MGNTSVVPDGLHVQTGQLFDQTTSVLCLIRKTTIASIRIEREA